MRWNDWPGSEFRACFNSLMLLHPLGRMDRGLLWRSHPIELHENCPTCLLPFNLLLCLLPLSIPHARYKLQATSTWWSLSSISLFSLFRVYYLYCVLSPSHSRLKLRITSERLDWTHRGAIYIYLYIYCSTHTLKVSLY